MRSVDSQHTLSPRTSAACHVSTACMPPGVNELVASRWAMSEWSEWRGEVGVESGGRKESMIQ